MRKTLSEKLRAKFPATACGYCPQASPVEGQSLQQKGKKRRKRKAKKNTKIEKSKDVLHFLVSKFWFLRKPEPKCRKMRCCWKERQAVMMWSTISKTRASVSSGYPNTEKQMKALGRRPSAFTVSRCLDTPIKHEGNNFSWSLSKKW